MEKIQGHKHQESLVFMSTIDTRITEDWGVEWDACEIARDFLQNFYDANPVDDIRIDIQGDSVKVSAPSVFDHQLLVYMKTTKKNEVDMVGKYGEGFKAASLNAIRNFKCGLTFYTEDKKLAFYFKDKKISGQDTRVLMCDLFTITPPVEGSILELTNCPSSLLKEFDFGLKNFYYEKNPLLGEVITRSYDHEITVYKSTTDTGYAFYGKLLRKNFDIPIVIVCNKKFAVVANKIKHDRDRKAFNDEVFQSFLKWVFKSIKSESRSLVLFMKDYWVTGHKILSVISNTARYQIDFPENLYARFHENNYIREKYGRQMDDCLSSFKKKGYKECRSYMSSFGMKTVYSESIRLDEELMKRHKEIYSRKPNVHEFKAIVHIENSIRVLVPGSAQSYKKISYVIGSSDGIIGELKKGSSFDRNIVYLSKNYFFYPYHDAVAVLLHEFSHVYGYDGSRGFTDALTNVISCLIKNLDQISGLEKTWKDLSTIVQDDYRKTHSINETELMIHSLMDDQKNKILLSIPGDELIKLIEKTR